MWKAILGTIICFIGGITLCRTIIQSTFNLIEAGEWLLILALIPIVLILCLIFFALPVDNITKLYKKQKDEQKRRKQVEEYNKIKDFFYPGRVLASVQIPKFMIKVISFNPSFPISSTHYFNGKVVSGPKHWGCQLFKANIDEWQDPPHYTSPLYKALNIEKNNE